MSNSFELTCADCPERLVMPNIRSDRDGRVHDERCYRWVHVDVTGHRVEHECFPIPMKVPSG